jgi:hypothetical protein
VAGVGEGVGADSYDVEPGQAEPGSVVGASGSSGAGSAADGAGGASGGGDEASVRLSFTLRLRRVRIRPKEKREEYVARLERIIELCESVLNSQGLMEDIQLKAADVIIRAIRMGYTIVREVDVENLERITAEIKAKLEERDRESSRKTEGEEQADPL